MRKVPMQCTSARCGPVQGVLPGPCQGVNQRRVCSVHPAQGVYPPKVRYWDPDRVFTLTRQVLRSLTGSGDSRACVRSPCSEPRQGVVLCKVCCQGPVKVLTSTGCVASTLHRVFTLPRYGIWTLTGCLPCQGKVLDLLQGSVKIEPVHGQTCCTPYWQVVVLCKVCQHNPIKV